MPAYWISHVHVTDPDSYKQYASRATGAIEAHGGRFLARNGAYRQLEGNDRARNVVIEFPDYATAVACYESPEYQAAMKHRLTASVGDLIIIEGYDGPQPS